MEISDVRIRHVRDAGDSLKAFCTITFDDDFVVRDLKIVEGTSGLFVAMPSRKLSEFCPGCGSKNHLRARFCNNCGEKLPSASVPTDAEGRPRLHTEIAHPINTKFREHLQQRVIEAYLADVEQEGSAPEKEDTAGEKRVKPRSEYNALIADLDKGGGDSDRFPRRRGGRDRWERDSEGGRPAEPSKREEAPRRGRPAEPSKREEAPRRGRRGGRRGREAEPAPAEAVAPDKREETAVVKPKAVEAKPEEGTGFGAGLFDSANSSPEPEPAVTRKPARSKKPKVEAEPEPEPVEDQVQLSEEVDAVVEYEDSAGDTAAFGAGLS